MNETYNVVVDLQTREVRIYPRNMEGTTIAGASSVHSLDEDNTPYVPLARKVVEKAQQAFGMDASKPIHLVLTHTEGSTEVKVSLEMTTTVIQLRREPKDNRVTAEQLVHLLQRGTVMVDDLKLSIASPDRSGGPVNPPGVAYHPPGEIDEDMARAILDVITEDVPDLYFKGFQLTPTDAVRTIGRTAQQDATPVAGSTAWLAWVLANADRIVVGEVNGQPRMLDQVPDKEASDIVAGWVQEKRVPVPTSWNDLPLELRHLMMMRQMEDAKEKWREDDEKREKEAADDECDDGHSGGIGDPL